MTTLTPSDAAMAARSILDSGRVQNLYPSAADSTEALFTRIIDRHFAPLREELAAVRANQESDRQYAHMMQEQRALISAHCVTLENDLTTLRASNDKLRAALEKAVKRIEWMARIRAEREFPSMSSTVYDNWMKNDAEFHEIKAALAPERKETT